MRVEQFQTNNGLYKVNLHAPASMTSNPEIILPEASGTLTVNTATQTLTNKTLTTPILTTPAMTTPTITTLVTPIQMTALGSSPVATSVVAEYGDGKRITTVLTLTNFIVGALNGAVSLALGNICYSFPAGVHLFLTSYFSLSFTCASTATTGKCGLGSTIGTGAITTLSTTMEDYVIDTTAVTGATGGAASVTMVAPTAGFGTGIALNIAASVKDVYLNAAASWAAGNTGNLTATGTIVLNWIKIA
jgi:hypothetical protein